MEFIIFFSLEISKFSFTIYIIDIVSLLDADVQWVTIFKLQAFENVECFVCFSCFLLHRSGWLTQQRRRIQTVFDWNSGKNSVEYIKRHERDWMMHSCVEVSSPWSWASNSENDCSENNLEFVPFLEKADFTLLQYKFSITCALVKNSRGGVLPGLAPKRFISFLETRSSKTGKSLPSRKSFWSSKGEELE